MSNVHGVVVLARNGDRLEVYQDPKTYDAAFTETTALGEVQSHQLGSTLRSLYLDSRSPSYVQGMRPNIVDNHEIHVRSKAGGEGSVVFDSAIALLQGLFPPNPNHKIVLANETTIVAPLGGYQYIPVETVEPSNDRSLESWTDCPEFQKHIVDFYKSDEFKAKAIEAEPFFHNIKDFVFGRETTLENIWNIYDFVNSELVHNITYAHRLPPTYIEQAQALVNFHENGVFSDKDISGIGNIAGRTVLNTILNSLERIAFNDDPLKFLLVETTYQPFISLFHLTGIVNSHPELQGVPNYASALAIELRRGAPPDTRDFLRFKFRNGTEGRFETLPVFGHHADIPLTEFIYRAENAAITSNRQWAQVCDSQSVTTQFLEATNYSTVHAVCSAAFALLFFFSFAMLFKVVRRSRAHGRTPVCLEGDERINVVTVSEKGRL
jgi:hypothetical protein